MRIRLSFLMMVVALAAGSPLSADPVTDPATDSGIGGPAVEEARDGGPEVLEGPAQGLRPAFEISERSAGETWIDANRAYDEGAWQEAVGLYGELLDRGFDDGRLHYNQGNALLRTGDVGRAIAAYRRSLARRPRDQDVEANLAFARQNVQDALEPPSPPPVLQTLFFWHYGMGRGELLMAFLVSNLLLWSLLAVRLFHRRSEVLRWAVTGSLTLVLALGGSLAVHLLFPQRVAVLTPSEATVHSGTSAETVVRFKLHAGSEVRVLDRRQGWLRIELPDGQQGWLPEEQAEVVRN